MKTVSTSVSPIPLLDTRAGGRSEFLGLGFEKLDRDVFDPEKAYPFLPATGVSWIRLQSGWQRTEREKGVYDFAWLDAIVDTMEPHLKKVFHDAEVKSDEEQRFDAYVEYGRRFMKIVDTAVAKRDAAK